MLSTADVLDEARELVLKRLKELDEERKRLERALAKLGGKATRRPGRPRGGKPASSAATSAPRKRRRGGRADQVIKVIKKSPGIEASGVAKALKIRPNYAYRLLGELTKEGRVKKQGRKYFPVG